MIQSNSGGIFNMTTMNTHKPCNLPALLHHPLSAAHCLHPPLLHPTHSQCSLLLYAHILPHPSRVHQVSPRSVCCHLTHPYEVWFIRKINRIMLHGCSTHKHWSDHRLIITKILHLWSPAPPSSSCMSLVSVSSSSVSSGWVGGGLGSSVPLDSIFTHKVMLLFHRVCVFVCVCMGGCVSTL